MDACGAILILPLFIGLTIFMWISCSVSGNGVDSRAASIQSKEQQAIEKYIRQARSKGLSDTEITSFLKEKGWSEEDIKKTFKNV